MIKLFLNIIIFIFVFSTTTYAQWLCPWENRIPFTITETSGNNLSNHQVRLDIPFLNGMNTDFSDLQFTASNGTTTLDYWIEISTTSTSAIVWVKIPILNANSSTTIYLYYCNPGATSASNGPNTFVFFDDFDVFQGWSNIGTGQVVSDNTAIPGTSLLAKTTNCDPNGGFKPIGTTLDEFRLISREIRLDDGITSCAWNRYGLEDANYNGYNIRRNADSAANGRDFGFERRNGGAASNVRIANMNHPRDIWYRTELRRCDATTNNLTAVLYGDDRSVIGTVNNTDQIYNSFDRITVRGGAAYHLDFVAVANFTCSDPTTTRGAIEQGLPTAICQNITVALNEFGEVAVSPSAIDHGSSDNCGFDNLTLSQSAFNCTHLGDNQVTFTVTDLHRNTATCNAIVTVIDTMAPIVSCPDDILVAANVADCSAIIHWTEPTVTDNCSEIQTSQSHQSGNVFPLGTTVVQYRARDASGNTASCSFTITVENNLAPPTITTTDNSGLNNDDGIICDGSSATLSGSSGYASYAWSNGANTQTIFANHPDNYLLTVTDNIGCTNTAEVEVVVNPLPQAGTCNLIHDLCQENTGGVTIKANGGLAPYLVNWTPNVGSFTTQTIPDSGGQINITNIPGGSTIDISVTDANGCTIE